MDWHQIRVKGQKLWKELDDDLKPYGRAVGYGGAALAGTTLFIGWPIGIVIGAATGVATFKADNFLGERKRYFNQRREEMERSRQAVSIARDKGKIAQEFFSEKESAARELVHSARGAQKQVQIDCSLSAPTNKRSAGKPTATWKLSEFDWNLLSQFKPRIRMFRTDPSNSLIEHGDAIERTGQAIVYEEVPSGYFVDQEAKSGHTANYYLVLTVTTTVEEPVFKDTAGQQVRKPDIWDGAEIVGFQRKNVDHHRVIARKRLTARRYFSKNERTSHKKETLIADSELDKLKRKLGVGQNFFEIDTMLQNLERGMELDRKFEAALNRLLEKAQGNGADEEVLEEIELHARDQYERFHS